MVFCNNDALSATKICNSRLLQEQNTLQKSIILLKYGIQLQKYRFILPAALRIQNLLVTNIIEIHISAKREVSAIKERNIKPRIDPTYSAEYIYCKLECVIWHKGRSRTVALTGGEKTAISPYLWTYSP